MESTRVVPITVILVFSFQIICCIQYSVKDKSDRHPEDKLCVELGKEPFFDIDLIVRKPWRIYYVWNINMGPRCVDMHFKNASEIIVNRFKIDMNDYTETSPNWAAATMLVSMGSASHEMLLFANQGPPGSFDGVPNVVKLENENFKPKPKDVPLLKFFIKLLEGGKFLLMVDCHSRGYGSLAAKEKPYRSEIVAIADKLNIGPGSMTCLTETTRKNEQVYLR